MIPAPLLLAAIGAGVTALMEPFRPTAHGANPWTLDAAVNVLAHAHLFEAARAIVEGTITSGFRSERVNQAVGGSPTSDHLAGRAVDIVSKYPPQEAAGRIFAAVARGELGAVREVLEEPGCVHVGWYPLGTTGAPRLGQWRMT